MRTGTRNQKKPGTDETFPCFREGLRWFGALSFSMPRSKRVVVVGAPHHITQRGNDRQDVFVSDGLRRVYIELLAEQGDERERRGRAGLTGDVRARGKMFCAHGWDGLERVVRDARERLADPLRHDSLGAGCYFT